MRRVPPDLLVLLAAAGGIALLAGLGRALDPTSVSLGDVPAHEGERVVVHARVLEAASGARATRLVLADAHHRLPAFAPPGLVVFPGDEVRAIGIASRLDDGPGLSLERVDLVARAAKRALGPAEVARDPQAYDGARILVLGEARADRLVGEDARLRVAGVAAPGTGWWLAEGVFRYRADEAAYVLRVESWTRPS